MRKRAVRTEEVADAVAFAHANGVIHRDLKPENTMLGDYGEVLLMDWGLIDVFRNKHPDSTEFSWWDYRGGAFHRKQGLRIDFLLATKSLMERVRSVEIDRENRKKKDGLTASDHAPVFADLD